MQLVNTSWSESIRAQLDAVSTVTNQNITHDRVGFTPILSLLKADDPVEHDANFLSTSLKQASVKKPQVDSEISKSEFRSASMTSEPKISDKVVTHRGELDFILLEKYELANEKRQENEKKRQVNESRKIMKK